MTISVSAIGIIVTIVLFLLLHVGTLVWFMGKISTVVTFLQKDLKKLGEVLDRFEQERYTIRDATKDWAYHKEEHKTLWQKYDRLEERVNEIGGPR